MRLALVLACFACTLLAPGASARAENYVIDQSHTSILFGVSHLGYSYTYGRFNKVTGSFSLGAGPEANQFHLNIEAASVDTNDAKRDAHLRGADFFNSQQFPLIQFQSTQVVPEETSTGMVLRVEGTLTMHGVERKIELELQKLGEGPGPTGADFRTGFICQKKLLRSEFGMKSMLPHIGDEIAITISFEGIRQEAQ